MVAIARQRSEQAQATAGFETADALELPFEADHFDCARSERVFMYLDDPEHAASELIRVTQPGGVVIVSDADLETSFWSFPGLDHTVLHRTKRLMAEGVRNGRIGSDLPRLMKQAGLTNIQLRTDVVTITDSDVALDGMGATIHRAALRFRSIDQGRRRGIDSSR
ncbi:MAG: methyltransferase domain-containing protein [Thermomicrobiales bacterium]